MRAMMDGEDGDEDRVAVLARRAQSLGRQLAEAQEMISPPQRRDLDPVEAVSRAHQQFVAVTRARMAEAGQSRPEPRPFDSVSRGRSTEHTGPDCAVCSAARERDAARDRAAFKAVYGAT
jgi:hypothetical protein